MKRELPLPANPPRLDLLSGFATVGAQRFALTGNDRNLLLALALARRGIAADRLTEAMWPQLASPAAYNRLYVALHRVRRRFTPFEIILQSGRSYRLDEGVVEVDLWSFARLWDNPAGHATQALADQLDACLAERAHRPLPEWMEPTLRRLEEFAQSVSTTLAERALASGELERSIQYAREALFRDECDERAWSVLIRSHLAAQDRIGALREYRIYSRALMRELQAPPAWELAHLLTECSILADSPSHTTA
ncbi:MAG: AfsR/SARP family transcriptional regulator [Vulcanimicrobiaceae bacterium]